LLKVLNILFKRLLAGRKKKYAKIEKTQCKMMREFVAENKLDKALDFLYFRRLFVCKSVETDFGIAIIIKTIIDFKKTNHIFS